MTHEPAEVETLDLQLNYAHGWNEREYVRIGVPEEGYISLCIVQFAKSWQPTIVQAVLNVGEADAVIVGLQEAIRRILMLRMTKDGEITVPSSEEYARQLEAEGWSYLTEPVEPVALPEDFPMRAELTTLGVTNTTQLDKFLDDFDGKMSQIKRARGKLD